MSFADNLKLMPTIDHLDGLDLVDEQGTLTAHIPNAPGKAGSVAVYHALFQRHGALTPAAAQEGLELFAEHTDKARQQPGAHPNIDRLIDVMERQVTLQIRLVEKAG